MIKTSSLAYRLVCPAICLLAAGCNQKEFDEVVTGERSYLELNAAYDHVWHLVYENGIDWAACWDKDEYMMTYESLLPEDPAGLSVMIYDNDNVSDIFNLPAAGGRIDLEPGVHNILLLNNDTEYIIFNNLEKEAQHIATTRMRSRSSFTGSPYVDRATNENTITPPDMLYACNGGIVEGATGQENRTLSYELRPLVYKYLIRYHFDCGLQFVTMARGAMAGMASSVYLSNGRTTTESATLLYEIDDMASRRYDDEGNGKGTLYNTLCTFGVPDFPNDYYARSQRTYGLNLEVLLTNGTAKTFDFDITDQIRRQPRGGVINVYGLQINDDEATVGEGAIDVSVDGWGNHYDIII